ncbi:MAG: biotin transporter BioY [Candidatus Ornithomonoglobus sp.]
MKKIKTRDLCLCAVFAALTAVGAFIKIPVPVCPFTLQLLFTTLAGLLIGKKLGALSVAIYVIIGLLGVPVFTQGGGFGYVLQPTFGYLVGYIAGSFVTGAIAGEDKEPKLLRLLLASLAGLLVVYLFGMVYLYIICNYVLGSPYTVGAVVLYCFVFAVPGDIVLCAVASVIAKRVIPALRKSDYERN